MAPQKEQVTNPLSPSPHREGFFLPLVKMSTIYTIAPIDCLIAQFHWSKCLQTQNMGDVVSPYSEASSNIYVGYTFSSSAGMSEANNFNSYEVITFYPKGFWVCSCFPKPN